MNQPDPKPQQHNLPPPISTLSSPSTTTNITTPDELQRAKELFELEMQTQRSALLLQQQQYQTKCDALTVIEDRLSLEREKLEWERFKFEKERMDEVFHQTQIINLWSPPSTTTTTTTSVSSEMDSYDTPPTLEILTGESLPFTNHNQQQSFNNNNDDDPTTTPDPSNLDNQLLEYLTRLHFHQRSELIQIQTAKTQKLLKQLKNLSIRLTKRESDLVVKEINNQLHEESLQQRETQLQLFQTQFAFVNQFLTASNKTHPVLTRPDNRNEEWYSYPFIMENLDMMQQTKALTTGREIGCQLMGLVQVFITNLDRHCLLYLPQYDSSYYRQPNHLTLAEQLWDPNGDLSLIFACQGEARDGLIPPLTPNLKVYISRDLPPPIKWHQIHGNGTFEASKLSFHHFVRRTDPGRNFDIDGYNDPCLPTCDGKSCTTSRHLRHIAHYGFHDYIAEGQDIVSARVHIKWSRPGDPDYGLVRVVHDGGGGGGDAKIVLSSGGGGVGGGGGG